MNPLNIAILGYNTKLSIYGFRQFLDNNREQVEKVNIPRNIAILKDGTRIEAITGSVVRNLRGERFDQLILFDDDRWAIEWHRAEDIEWIKYLTMQTTIIPEEFQILKYEDIR